MTVKHKYFNDDMLLVVWTQSANKTTFRQEFKANHSESKARLIRRSRVRYEGAENRKKTEEVERTVTQTVREFLKDEGLTNITVSNNT